MIFTIDEIYPRYRKNLLYSWCGSIAVFASSWLLMSGLFHIIVTPELATRHVELRIALQPSQTRSVAAASAARSGPVGATQGAQPISASAGEPRATTAPSASAEASHAVAISNEPGQARASIQRPVEVSAAVPVAEARTEIAATPARSTAAVADALPSNIPAPAPVISDEQKAARALAAWRGTRASNGSTASPTALALSEPSASGFSGGHATAGDRNANTGASSGTPSGVADEGGAPVHADRTVSGSGSTGGSGSVGGRGSDEAARVAGLGGAGAGSSRENGSAHGSGSRGSGASAGVIGEINRRASRLANYGAQMPDAFTGRMLAFKVVVGLDGRVEDVIRLTEMPADVGAKITDEIKRWTFNPPGERVTHTLRFVLAAV